MRLCLDRAAQKAMWEWLRTAALQVLRSSLTDAEYNVVEWIALDEPNAFKVSPYFLAHSTTCRFYFVSVCVSAPRFL